MILSDVSFCLLDIETTGLSANQHEITEIAGIRVGEGFQVIEEMSFLVRVSQPVPWHITRITGICDRLLRAEGRPLADVLETMHGLTDGRRTFAHNARFDRSFMNVSAQRSGLGIEFPLECSIPVFKRLLPERKGYGLPVLADALRVSGGGAHRALADCRVLLECLKKAHGLALGRPR